MTPLHFAAYYGHYEVVIALVNAKADANATNIEVSNFISRNNVLIYFLPQGVILVLSYVSDLFNRYSILDIN